MPERRCVICGEALPPGRRSYCPPPGRTGPSSPPRPSCAVVARRRARSIRRWRAGGDLLASPALGLIERSGVSLTTAEIQGMLGADTRKGRAAVRLTLGRLVVHGLVGRCGEPARFFPRSWAGDTADRADITALRATLRAAGASPTRVEGTSNPNETGEGS